MPRWTGTWLEGPGVTLGELRNPDTYSGERLGLPREGTGSVATFSGRLAAFTLDILASALVAGLLNVWVSSPTPAQRQLAAFGVLAAESVLLVALAGQTLGMRLMGLKVLCRKDITRPPGLLPALTRTVPLLLSLGLTGFFTKDGRGLHDLAAGTVVIRS
jgi:uncharacterized RDD family membrane protein YckC